MYNNMILGLIFNIVISFGIPIGFIIYFKKTNKKVFKPLLVGALAFFISQIILRIPLINIIFTKNKDLSNLMMLNPIIYIFVLSITAGIFEEIARFLGFKCLKNNRRWIDGVAFGIGHGGIEAIIVVGISSIQQLIMTISLMNGKFNGEMFGVSELRFTAMIESIKINEIFLGGLERVFAMTFHIGLTLIVLYSVKKAKVRYLLIAIGLHTAFNFVAVFLIQKGVSAFVVEMVIGLFSIGMLGYILKSKNIIDLKDGEGIS